MLCPHTPAGKCSGCQTRLSVLEGRPGGAGQQGARAGARGRPEEPEQVPAWDQGRQHCSEPWAPLSLDTQNRGVCLGMNTRGGKTSALDQRED